MSVPIVSAIVAHKFAAALLIASLVTSGGVVAVAGHGDHQSNNLGQLSFSVNPAFNVTSLASLNLGALTGGQKGMMSSMATVNFTSTGNYTVALVNLGMLHRVFSAFNVTITGLGSHQINLTLNHVSQTINLTNKGVDNVKISVTYIVSNHIASDQTITVTNAPFVELFNGTVPGPHHGVSNHPQGPPNTAPPDSDNN